jgi:GNAT superfamily N-acetyltransferase
MTEVVVVSAKENEAPACLALLPRAVGAPAELLIARRDGQFSGASAVFWVSASDPPGFQVDVRVLTEWRRKGVGRALLEAAADLADGETDGLWALEGTSVASPAARFLEACGFKPVRREHHYQVANDTLLADMIDLAARMRARGRIPQGAEIAWLSEPGAPLEEIAWLLSKEFESRPMTNLQSLRRRRAEKEDHSVYVRVDGEVAAVMLVHAEGNIGTVDARAVARRWRNNWPNVAMLEKALVAASAAGVAKTRFFCDENIRDTINLARRGDGEEIDVKQRYYLSFSQ